MQGLVPNPITSARQVLAQYEKRYQPRRLDPLGSAGGFSGARFWRVESAAGQLCLRRWPVEHPTRDRLEQIHRILRHARSSGLQFLPAPFSDSRGHSIVAAEGHLWELAPWLPGRADFHQFPTSPRLRSAMAALARFHLVAAELPGAVGRGVSTALGERQYLLQDLLRGGKQRIAAAVVPSVWPELTGRARRWLGYVPDLAPNLARQAEFLADEPRAVQPCIRDIWHDHVLFEGDEVSGIVDFGAMRQDHVAVDVARLVGSLVGDAADDRRQAFAAYQKLRPLTADEWQLVEVLDASAVLLSGLNWLNWIYIEGREFEDRKRVVARFDEILIRLGTLAKRTGRNPRLPDGV